MLARPKRASYIPRNESINSTMAIYTLPTIPQ